jgi:hypothetical protein
VKVCVRVPGPGRRRRREVRTFSTMTNDLLLMRDWLLAERVTVVGMEATGAYWKPVFYLLEHDMDCWLLNARHMKAVPGRKTDPLTELSDGSAGWSVRLSAGVARFPARGQGWGRAAGVGRAGGAAARVA